MKSKVCHVDVFSVVRNFDVAGRNVVIPHTSLLLKSIAVAKKNMLAIAECFITTESACMQFTNSFGVMTEITYKTNKSQSICLQT